MHTPRWSLSQGFTAIGDVHWRVIVRASMYCLSFTRSFGKQLWITIYFPSFRCYTKAKETIYHRLYNLQICEQNKHFLITSLSVWSIWHIKKKGDQYTMASFSFPLVAIYCSNWFVNAKMFFYTLNKCDQIVMFNSSWYYFMHILNLNLITLHYKRLIYYIKFIQVLY